MSFRRSSLKIPYLPDGNFPRLRKAEGKHLETNLRTFRDFVWGFQGENPNPARADRGNVFRLEVIRHHLPRVSLEVAGVFKDIRKWAGTHSDELVRFMSIGQDGVSGLAIPLLSLKLEEWLSLPGKRSLSSIWASWEIPFIRFPPCALLPSRGRRSMW